MILSSAKKCNLPKLAQEIRASETIIGLAGHAIILRYDGFSTNERLDGEMLFDGTNTHLTLHESDVAHNPQIRSNTIGSELQAAIEAVVTAHTA